MSNPCHYGYGRIFGVHGMPTLQQQKLACFDFCNKLGFEWGGFHGDEYVMRERPFHKRQFGAEMLAMNVAGIIVAKFDAAFPTPQSFVHTSERCAANGIALYCLDFGEENIAGDEKFQRFAKLVTSRTTKARESAIEATNVQTYNGFFRPPLGWKKVPTRYKTGQKWRIVPDHYVRAAALKAYDYFSQGMGREEVARSLRPHRYKNPKTKEYFSPDWCEDAFRAVVCGFPRDTHRVEEAFAGFSFRAWRQGDPDTLALLQRCADTFRDLRTRMYESSVTAQELRPQLELSCSAAESAPAPA